MKTLVAAAGIAGLAFAIPVMAQTKQAVTIIVKDVTLPYWQTVLAGARTAGQDLGVDVVELGARSESDAKGQIDLLKTAIAARPSAIVIAPAQGAALAGPIDEAAKKVKIIAIGSAADNKATTSLMATDNVNVGRLAAEALAKAITKTYGDTEGNIVIMTSMLGMAALEQRVKGFKEVLAAKYRALDIVADKVADGEPSTALGIMRDLIANTPDLRGVFVADPVIAQAVGQAVAESKSGDKINAVGVGSDQKLVELLQSDIIAGLVVEDPFRMGYEGIKTALAASKGEQVAATIDIGATLVTTANIGSRAHLNSKVK